MAGRLVQMVADLRPDRCVQHDDKAPTHNSDDEKQLNVRLVALCWARPDSYAVCDAACASVCITLLCPALP